MVPRLGGVCGRVLARVGLPLRLEPGPVLGEHLDELVTLPGVTVPEQRLGEPVDLAVAHRHGRAVHRHQRVPEVEGDGFEDHRRQPVSPSRRGIAVS